MKKKIIVVDNHPVILKYMTDLLEKQGHRVKTAEDGLAALKILDTWIPDVMFIDMVMPNICGDKLCRIIRSMPKLNHVYIIILSAIATESEIDFIEIGANACIAKGPFYKMSKHVLDVLNSMDQEGKNRFSGKIKGIDDVFQREITKELLSSKKHFEVIMNNMSEGIIEINPAAEIIYVNPSAVSLTGIDEEKLLASDLTELFQDDQRERIKNLIDAAESSPKVNDDESPFKLNGKKVSINILPVEDQAHKSAVIVINDITFQKQMENRLQDVRNVQAIATLAGGIAHNFNNALTGITGNIELLKMSLQEDENIIKYTDKMDESARYMANLTGQLLSYAQGGKYQAKVISVSDIIENTISLIRHTIDPGIKVEKSIAGNVSRIKADFTQMQMIISAIVANAQEAIEGKGIIRIYVKDEEIDDDSACILDAKPGHYVCFTVEDKGKGMDEKTKNKMFDPFFTTKFHGRGLGMAAVHGIVKNHDGCISVESKPGMGTKVHIFLPAVETEVVEGTAKSIEPKNGSGTILVIEDEEMVMDVSRKMLEKLDYQVLQARNGAEAGNITKSYNGDIDLAILDICLPDIMGQRLYTLITEARPGLKVIVASGYDLEGPAKEILDAGAQGFIQKPYSLAELSEKVGEVLGVGLSA